MSRDPPQVDRLPHYNETMTRRRGTIAFGCNSKGKTWVPSSRPGTGIWDDWYYWAAAARGAAAAGRWARRKVRM